MHEPQHRSLGPANGEALSLAPAAVPRQVVTCRGRVWLTLDGSPEAAAQRPLAAPGELSRCRPGGARRAGGLA